MAKRNGGIIGPDNVPAGPLGAAGGVWRLEDAFNAQKAGTWPVVLGYQIPNSARFNAGSSDYLNRTPASAGNRKTWTWSAWVKLLGTNMYLFGASSDSWGANYSTIWINSGAQLRLELGGISGDIVSANLFRDSSAWYHFVVAVDTTQATANNRVRMYVNGVETTYNTQTMPAQNSDTMINSAQYHQISGRPSTQYLNGYLAEINLIDGQQLTPSSFGETDATTGIWIPKAYTGTYGTNGFYLNFANSADLGNDVSGNNNDFTANNLTSIDQSYDSPTNNFATFNSLFTPSPSNLSTFTEGNLKIATNSTSKNSDGLSTLGLTAGKWYGEFKLISEATGESVCGVKNNIENPTTDGLHGTGGFSVASNGDSFNNGSSQGVGNFSATYTTNDIISVALDLDNNKVYFAKNGSWTNGTGSWNQSSPTGSFTLTSGQTYFMGVGDKSSSQSSTWEANFGYPPFTISSGNADANGFGNFEYAVPSGYYALCTKNLALYG